MVTMPLLLSIAAIILAVAVTTYLLKRVSSIDNRIKYLYKLYRLKRIRRPPRLRKRYVVFAIISNGQFEKESVEKTIRKTWKEVFGELSLSSADPQLIYYEPSIQRGIIRIRHTYKKECLALLGLIRRINGDECLVVPLSVSGTLKRAQRKLYRLRRDLQPR